MGDSEQFDGLTEEVPSASDAVPERRLETSEEEPSDQTDRDATADLNDALAELATPEGPAPSEDDPGPEADPASLDATSPDDTAEEPAAPEPTPADGDPAPTLEDLEQLERELTRHLEGLSEAFNDKLLYDRTKDQMVDRLHQELQGYKADLVAQTSLPLARGMIRVHDDLGRLVEALTRTGEESFGAERVFELLRGFQEDVLLLLEDNGFDSYQEPGEKLDGRRQQVLETVPSEEPERAGFIARRLRRGFERDGRVVRKERVAVFKAVESPVTSDTPSEEESQASAQKENEE